MHIGFGVNAPPTPFVSALVLLDGAAVSVYGTLLEIPIEEVRIGMRVEPVWVEDDRADAPASRTSSTGGRSTSPTSPAEQLKGHM